MPTCIKLNLSASVFPQAARFVSKINAAQSPLNYKLSHQSQVHYRTWSPDMNYYHYYTRLTPSIPGQPGKPVPER